jgi:saccharopine dehydrogenase-like NADP-dependent oxidoreductase
MIISVVGAGAIGSAVAHELLSRDAVTEVRVCDARSRALQSLSEVAQSSKLRPFQVEGRDENVLAQVLGGSQCVVGCADPRLNLTIAHVCLAIGAHYCDAGGIDAVSESVLDLDVQAREKKLWLIPNCGLAPGLANVLCLLGLEEFDEADHAHVRVGDITLGADPEADYRVSTSPQKMIEDYTNPAYVIQDGVLTAVPPLSRVEHIFFEEPYGVLEASCTAVSGTALIGSFIDKVRNLDIKTIKRPGHADQWRFLIALGFADRRSIDLRTHLTYRDVLLRRLRSLIDDTRPEAVLLRVLVGGIKDGTEKTVIYEMILRSEAEDKIGAVRLATSIPTATVAEALAAGEVSPGGASVPELALDKADFVRRVAERGMPVKSRWYDGWLDVSDPQHARMA